MDIEIAWHPYTAPDGRAFEVGHYVRPGYDCREKCEHGKTGSDGQHGIHGDEWCYILRHERASLVLRLGTAFLRGAVVALLAKSMDHHSSLSGSDLTLHTEFVTDVEDIRTPPEPDDCPYTISGKCMACPRSTALGADDLLEKANPSSTHDIVRVGELVWPHMIKWFDAWYTDVLKEAAQAERVVQCPHCKGTGLVER